MKKLLTVLNIIFIFSLLTGAEKPAFSEKNLLSLKNGAKSVVGKIAVDALSAYRLKFSARVEGSGNFEDSPQLEYLFMYYEKEKKGRKMAGWKIIFRDASGKEIKKRGANFWKCVFSKKFQLYNDEFYAPEEAAFLSVEFFAGETEDSLYVKDISLEKMDISRTLNVNPDFKLGPYNYSGIAEQKNVKMALDEKGICKLDLRNGWAIGESIPVKEGDNLKVSISGTGYKKMGAALKFRYYDNCGKQIGQESGNLRIQEGQHKILEYDFIVPENARSIKFFVGGAVFDWIKLEKIK